MSGMQGRAPDLQAGCRRLAIRTATPTLASPVASIASEAGGGGDRPGDIALEGPQDVVGDAGGVNHQS